MASAPGPKWLMWRFIADLARWEAVALSLGIDPTPLKGTDWADVEAVSEIHPEFIERLTILVRNEGVRPTSLSLTDPAESTVNAQEFAAWALSIGWKVPGELKAFAVLGQKRKSEDGKSWRPPAPRLDVAARAAYWTVDECAAYTLNVDPSMVTRTYIELLPQHIRAEFAHRQELALRAIEAGELDLIGVNRPFIRGYHTANVPRDQFIAWARAKYQSIAPELEAALAASEPVDWKMRYEQEREKSDRLAKEIQHLRESKWPWGNYSTGLLWELAAAVEHWWKSYDSSQPEAAPTNEQVARWLRLRGKAARVAPYIAQIIRADGLPPGRRKSSRGK